MFPYTVIRVNLYLLSLGALLFVILLALRMWQEAQTAKAIHDNRVIQRADEQVLVFPSKEPPPAQRIKAA